ncbi:MAG: toll/interleukin receptor protein [Flavipsychrobacter sp.]|nr:toll/interleukin receptor protein [Flavipsychrobacter sp.]
MKHSRKILLTALSVIMIFTAIVYSSCYRDPCNGVYCQNGGACSRGTCLCPTGYTGAYCQYRAASTIAYYNNTYTPVYITINGKSATIPVGGSVEYDGTPGNYATGSAYTSGQASNGYTIGQTIYWDFNDYFPQGGIQTVDINVSPDYFFLKIQNYSRYYIDQGYVNYHLSSQYFDNMYIPNDGYTYDIGYYEAYTNSNVRLETATGSHYWYSGISLPFTYNQSYTFVAN